MGQIEKHSKIALGLRRGIKSRRPVLQNSSESQGIEQLDIFE